MNKILETVLHKLEIKVDLQVISSKVKNLSADKYSIHIIDTLMVYLYLQKTAPRLNCYNSLIFKTFNNDRTTIHYDVDEYDFSSTSVNYDGIEIEVYYKSKPTTGTRCGKENDTCPFAYAKKTYPNCCKGFKCIEHPNGWYADCHAPTPPPMPTPEPPQCIPNNSNKDPSNQSYIISNRNTTPDVTYGFLNGHSKGVNITGFDNRGSDGLNGIDAKSQSPFLTDAILVQQHYAITTIDPSFNNYIIDNSIQIARLPVMPFFIFKRNPYPFIEGSSALSPIFDGVYSNDCDCKEKPYIYKGENWCPGGMKCNDNSGVWTGGCPNYLLAIKNLIRQKIFCIIDIHSDGYNLCSLSDNKGVPMSPENFIAMWQHIAYYIFTNLPPEEHKYIIFELCNEPVGDDYCLPISGCNAQAGNKTCQQNYDLLYQIPTIKAIKALEIEYSNGVSHIIMVTTYNNWSGVHFWPQGGNHDGTLDQLATDLSTAGYSNSIKNKVIIAGHQYCDSNYSGEGPDCMQGFAYKAKDWLTGIDNILTPHNLLWFQTEGNIMANGTALTNQKEYKNYLASLEKNKSNIGYTLWFMNSSSLIYTQRNVGLGNMNFPNNKDNYSKIYKYNGIYLYDISLQLPKYDFHNLLKTNS